LTLQIIDLLKTKEKFLTCKTYSEVSNSLGITEHAVRYRLEKLRSLTGTDFKKNFSFEHIKKLKKKIKKEILDGKYYSMRECAKFYGVENVGYLSKIIDVTQNDFKVIRRRVNSQKVINDYLHIVKKLRYFPGLRKLRSIKKFTLLSMIYYYFDSFGDFLDLAKSYQYKDVKILRKVIQSKGKRFKNK
jgi:DNA-binding Lrp family transcriptional regulator